MTSLAALTLEVYYRYLPLYQLDKEKAAGGGANKGGGGEGLQEAVKAGKGGGDAKKDAKAPEAKKEAKAPDAKKDAKK